MSFPPLPWPTIDQVPVLLEEDIEDLLIPQEPSEVTVGHIRAYRVAVIARTSAATGSNHYWALQ